MRRFAVRKLSVCVLFGGISPEHEVSLRSAESVLNNIDHSKYNVFPVGITKGGDWIHFTSRDYSLLPSGQWEQEPGNRRAAISPVRGQGLLTFEGDCVVGSGLTWCSRSFTAPMVRTEPCRGLLQLAGIPYVGSHVAASAVAMDKTLTKLVADQAGIHQAAWRLVWRRGEHQKERVLNALEEQFQYPMFVKPAGHRVLRRRIQSEKPGGADCRPGDGSPIRPENSGGGVHSRPGN